MERSLGKVARVSHRGGDQSPSQRITGRTVLDRIERTKRGRTTLSVGFFASSGSWVRVPSSPLDKSAAQGRCGTCTISVQLTPLWHIHGTSAFVRAGSSGSAGPNTWCATSRRGRLGWPSGAGDEALILLLSSVSVGTRMLARPVAEMHAQAGQHLGHLTCDSTTGTKSSAGGGRL